MRVRQLADLATLLRHDRGRFSGPQRPPEPNRSTAIRAVEIAPLDFWGSASAESRRRVARRIILCDGADLARLWGHIGAAENEVLTWVPREDGKRARPPGFHALPGGLAPESILKLNPKTGDVIAIATEDLRFARAAISAIDEAVPDAPVLLLSDRIDTLDLPDHACLLRGRLRSLIRDDIDEEFDHLDNLQRVVELRALFEPRVRVGILLQPDPDPDGIASGYALRMLLGRKRPTAPLISFGEVKRPENRAMIEALGIDVRTVTPADLEEFDGLALVDVQPTVFGENPPARVRSVDAVIDHHPERSGYDTVVRDIRSSYGSTSTIFTEYIRAAGVEMNARLATALVYGIKSDTQLLGRETSRADIAAFAFLHAYHSPALLRRIERPALPTDGLRALGRALSRTEVEEGVHLLVLGPVGEEMIPQVADLGLQAEGAEWSIAAGVVGSDLVFSVRNVGYVRAAGDVVRRVVEGLGVGGGHRSMAKGIIPLKAFRKVYGSAARDAIRVALRDAFIEAIYREDD
jgi:nanoRNase/pAp phosphatase (c-di-AMP/oligoRNAs hydrolase)